MGHLVFILAGCAPGDSDPNTEQDPAAEAPGPRERDPASYTTVRGETDRIRLDSPLPGDTVRSPLTIRGQARGGWYFEADFPVVLANWDGLVIAEHYATAQGEWMTPEYVPFEAVLEFEAPEFIGEFSRRGSLILQRDNPSDLPANDDALEITVYFGEGG
jgi:hypothetical protein